MDTVTYANGFSVRYVYDDLDRVKKIYQKNGNAMEELTFEMIYNGDGELYEIRNFRTGRASFFAYDHAGRCMASKERSFTVSGDTQFSSSYRFRNEHSGTARSIPLVLE